MSKDLTSEWENTPAAHAVSSDTPSRVSQPVSEDGRNDETRINNHGLPSRNVVIDGKRTSIRLDAYSLESLL